ncbi:BCCT, betaine/carnitine/choline family transporter [Natranaerofaba carboxydovora]|nr:BCCT, betaine/carnitine/choline family transporter [Natranaerofaba carboxydovora]
MLLFLPGDYKFPGFLYYNLLNKINVNVFGNIKNKKDLVFNSINSKPMVMVYFMTSSVSGSLVVNKITSSGKLNTPRTQRAFWAILK